MYAQTIFYQLNIRILSISLLCQHSINAQMIPKWSRSFIHHLCTFFQEKQTSVLYYFSSYQNVFIWCVILVAWELMKRKCLFLEHKRAQMMCKRMSPHFGVIWALMGCWGLYLKILYLISRMRRKHQFLYCLHKRCINKWKWFINILMIWGANFKEVQT